MVSVSTSFEIAEKESPITLEQALSSAEVGATSSVTYHYHQPQRWQQHPEIRVKMLQRCVQR
jgi:hypothetical protein